MSSLGWVKRCNWGVFDLVRRREYTIKFLTSRVNAWWIVVYHGISILPSPWLAGAPLGKPRAAPIFGSWIPAEQHTDAHRSPKSSTESITESSTTPISVILKAWNQTNAHHTFIWGSARQTKCSWVGYEMFWSFSFISHLRVNPLNTVP